MASAREQHLPYCSTADVVVLDGDGSRWVREDTCYLVEDEEGRTACSECGWSGQLWEYIGFGDMGSFVPKFCPECGREILGERLIIRKECLGEVQTKQTL